MQWVVWVQHLGSRPWHEVTRSLDFETCYRALEKYVRDNQAIVKFYILLSNTTPAMLPSDYPPAMELRG